jgi:molybdopterin-guanine dinucleotide biosynthesis protein A
MLRPMASGARDGTPLGVVLAGGEGRRIGGDKAIVELEGRPLVLYPIEALHEVCDEVVVVAKRDTLLPALTGVADLWVEPDAPRHPLCGLVHALKLAEGRPALVLGVDLPLVDAATLRALVAAAEAAPDALAVVPRVHGRLEPFCALYRPAALPALEGFADGARVLDVVASLAPEVLEPDDGTPFFNVNRPEDLLQAGTLLRGG